MPGLRQNESEKTVDFIDDILLDEFAEDLDDDEPVKASRRASSNGEYLRKIEMRMEEKRLKEDLSDYDWDDI